MILQALKEYYDRKPELPREGWELKEIAFLVLIDWQGNFVGFEDTREYDGKRLRAKQFLVPSLGEKKGAGIKANLFWENIEYIFGIPVPTEAKKAPKPDRVNRQHQEFTKRLAEIKGTCAVLEAVRRFYEGNYQEAVRKDKSWSDVLKLNQSLLFSMVDCGPVTSDAELCGLLDSSRARDEIRGCCMLTGIEEEIARLEPAIKGVKGANPTGASLVSVNNDVNNGINTGPTPAFASFLKMQGYNSPIGKTASFAYTTALNHLLRRDSRQKLQVGDATTVFWSEKKTCFEEEMCFFFSEPPKDDPDQDTEAVRALYQSIWTGTYVVPDESTLFYALGLSPNSARIAVRFWHVDTIREVGSRLKQHVEDLTIAHEAKTDPALPMQRLLRSVAPQEDIEKVPPNLAGEMMRAVLEGTPYPVTLLQAALRRCRAEQSKKDRRTGRQIPNVPYERAALIKACLNRALRFNNPKHEKELAMCTDPANTNVGYRLGRLFAVLEKIQSDANPGINATVRDRFYGAASSTPLTVFGNLMRLSSHHLSKLEKEKPGLAVIRKKLIGEIICSVTDFPSHLDLADQGRFAIGYYHQTQDLWTKKL
jgi:CRISPR-associated protein Csd1